MGSLLFQSILTGVPIEIMAYKISFCILLLLFTCKGTIADTNLTSSCGGEWFEIPNQGCFLFNLTLKLSWMDAQIFCEDSGGYLIEEIDADLEASLMLFTSLIGDGNRDVNAWLGGYDLGHEGDWRWIHSENPIGDTFWATDEHPALDDTKNCLRFDNYGDYGWYDYDCDALLSVICQRPQGWTSCGTITTDDTNENYQQLLNCPKNPGLMWKLADSTGVCAQTENGLLDWEFPNDDAQKSLGFYLDTWGSSGYITPATSRTDSDNCAIQSAAVWKDTESIRAVRTSSGSSLTVYYF